MHPAIAEMCLDAGRNMLTASYASDQLRKIAKRSVNIRVYICYDKNKTAHVPPAM